MMITIVVVVRTSVVETVHSKGDTRPSTETAVARGREEGEEGLTETTEMTEVAATEIETETG